MRMRGGGVGRVNSVFLSGGLKDLIQEKNEEGYVLIEVRPEGYIDGSGSDTTLNSRDMRSKFGYTTSCDIVGLRKDERNTKVPVFFPRPY